MWSSILFVALIFGSFCYCVLDFYVDLDIDTFEFDLEIYTRWLDKDSRYSSLTSSIMFSKLD